LRRRRQGSAPNTRRNWRLMTKIVNTSGQARGSDPWRENGGLLNRRRSSFGLSVAQERAIGQMTVKFNWMEHALEVLIDLALGTESDLASPFVRRMGFGTKVDVLKELVEKLYVHVPNENVEAYQDFVSAVTKLISQAKELNTFRNSIVHWRPFLQDVTPKVKIEASSETIAQKADEMELVGYQLFRRALGIRRGSDNALVFGPLPFSELNATKS
jgi:hypothetical protein